jgi:hypothetical protein
MRIDASEKGQQWVVLGIGLTKHRHQKTRKTDQLITTIAISIQKWINNFYFSHTIRSYCRAIAINAATRTGYLLIDEIIACLLC